VRIIRSDSKRVRALPLVDTSGHVCMSPREGHNDIVTGAKNKEEIKKY